MRLRLCLVLTIIACTACGGSPLAPSNSVPPGPRRNALEGYVIDGDDGQRLAGAVVVVADGPNAGESATTETSGYFILWLEVGGFTLDVRRDGYAPHSQAVTMLTSASTRVEIRLTRIR